MFTRVERARRIALAVILPSSALVLLTVLAAGCLDTKTVRAPAIGAAAPGFAAQDLDGNRVSLAELRGKVVVLNEWATWCEPCRGELPQLEALHQRFASRGLVLVGVSVDGAGMGADVRDFTREHGLHYPIWLDPEKQFALHFLTMGVPETFVIDRDGVIRWRKIGALPDGDTTLASAVQRVLGS
ncbi:MAG: TlpA disulfide reductase family protein [bacterium]